MVIIVVEEVLEVGGDWRIKEGCIVVVIVKNIFCF